MQNYTLFNLYRDVDSNLHVGAISELQDFYATVDKGRRNMIGKIRPEELIRKGYIEQALFPDVDRYAVPFDMKYRDIIEINLLSGYRNVDTMSRPLMQVFRRRFGQKRHGSKNVINIGYENGVKYASILHPKGINHNPSLQQGVDGEQTITVGNSFTPIHNFDSLNDNGTWNSGGNVSNLRQDDLFHISGKGSLKFDILAGSTTGYLENFTLDEFDLDDYRQRGAVFLWLSCPIPKELLSVKLTMGSNTTDLTTDLYYSTVNQPHDSNEFTSLWNLLKYMMNSMNTIGTPNPKALKYIRVDFTTTGQAIPNCNIDNIIARKGRVYEITYNGSYCLIDPVSRAWKKIGTDLGDIIVAEDDTYNILLWETTIEAQKEIYGNNTGAKYDVAEYQNNLKEAYYVYFREHPSEALLEEDSYHIYGNMYDGYSDDPMDGDNWGNY